MGLRPVPGEAEAIEAEGLARDAAFLGLPLAVCGVGVRPVTLRDYLWLSVARSPFVRGGLPMREDALLLLWRQRSAPGRTPAARRRFVRSLEPLADGELIAAVAGYVDDALADAPGGSVGGGPAYWGLAAGLGHTFRRAFPQMTRDDVLDTDLRILWQEERVIRREHDPKAILFNRSSRVRSEYNARLDAERAAAAAAARPPAAPPSPSPSKRRPKQP